MRSVEVWEIGLRLNDAAFENCRKYWTARTVAAGQVSDGDLRRRFTVSHAVTEDDSERLSGLRAGGVAYELGRWGKPAVVGSPWLQHNLSHSGSSPCWRSRLDGPVGVDVEAVQHSGGGCGAGEPVLPAVGGESVSCATAAPAGPGGFCGCGPERRPPERLLGYPLIRR